ncbi:DUF3310 domain-containing protein [Akkermansiaceae bacterium]|nr:DUF3310 domain-containing protein [Akkermansiaceae bacterium]
MNHKIYTPRKPKRSILDRLENIDYEPPKKEEPVMSIGKEAMRQLETLSESDGLDVTLCEMVSKFNSNYRKHPDEYIDTMAHPFIDTDENEEDLIPTVTDQVNSPSHYMLWPDTEVIDILRKVLSEDELRGWMKGNSLKYRLRLGAKDNTEQDLAKAEKFEQWLGDLH